MEVLLEEIYFFDIMVLRFIGDKEISMLNEWSKKKVIVIVLLCVLIGNGLIIYLLPKGIGSLFRTFGHELDSSDLQTKYLVGTAVRILGSLLYLLLIIKTGIIKQISTRIRVKHLVISWMFYIYIIFNIETGNLTRDQFGLVLLMVISCVFVGLFEEILFRGTILPILLSKWGNSRKQIYGCVILSSSLFGVFHLTNLLNDVPPITVFVQVFYATVIGIAFAAIYLRTNNNLLWCVILHALYDIATEIGDVIASGMESTEGVADKAASVVTTTSIDVVPYLVEQLVFIPLLLYSLFLLRKVVKIDDHGVAVI
jgi:membrane protease YdiL (CAAX protease family)